MPSHVSPLLYHYITVSYVCIDVCNVQHLSLSRLNFSCEADWKCCICDNVIANKHVYPQISMYSDSCLTLSFKRKQLSIDPEAIFT